jgi:hypothetical protein
MTSAAGEEEWKRKPARAHRNAEAGVTKGWPPLDNERARLDRAEGTRKPKRGDWSSLPDHSTQRRQCPAGERAAGPGRTVVDGQKEPEAMNRGAEMWRKVRSAAPE